MWFIFFPCPTLGITGMVINTSISTQRHTQALISVRTLQMSLTTHFLLLDLILMRSDYEYYAAPDHSDFYSLPFPNDMAPLNFVL